MSLPLVADAAALKFAPWSYSKLELAETCPKQFQHRYLLKTEAGPSTPDTRVGTAAHAVLERRVKGTDKTAAVREALEETPLTSNEEEMLSSFDDRIESFLTRFDFFCRSNGVKEVLVEVEWAFSADMRPVGFFSPDAYFRGKADLGAITRDNDLFIIDHKSGVAKDLSRDTKKQQQLNTYAVLAAVNRPDIAGVRGGISFLQGDPNKALQWVDYAPVKRVMDVHAPWLISRINYVSRGLVEPFVAKPAKRWPCGWCQYSSRCQEYQSLYGSDQ